MARDGNELLEQLRLLNAMKQGPQAPLPPTADEATQQISDAASLDQVPQSSPIPVERLPAAAPIENDTPSDEYESAMIEAEENLRLARETVNPEEKKMYIMKSISVLNKVGENGRK